MTIPARERRYDIDWVRILALGLMIAYHGLVFFQPWAGKLLFLQNNETLETLWRFPAEMINVWRIPILFVLSGMGVWFAMSHRNGYQLLIDRALRILLPLAAGSILICPLIPVIYLRFNGEPIKYLPNVGHLWFLGNIFIYFLFFLPIFLYLKKHPDNWFWRILNYIMKHPLGLMLFILLLILEAWLLQPEYFAHYYFTPHGLVMGAICFFMGFLFVANGPAFWSAVQIYRWVMLITAFVIYLIRLFVFESKGIPSQIYGAESGLWILAVFGFASLHLNRPSKMLSQLSRAVYPVYIIHLPVQMSIAFMILPMEISAAMKLVFLLVGTYIASALIYYFILKRTGPLGVLFGMNIKKERFNFS